ncbi:MAG: hypothetical protein AAF736_03645 [Pseudomonadota bacterium]
MSRPQTDRWLFRDRFLKSVETSLLSHYPYGMKALIGMLVLLLSGPSWAQTDALSTVQINPVSDVSGAAIALSVSGQWESTCTPLIDDLRLEGRGLTLLASYETDKACAKTASGYSLSVDLAEYDLSALEPGVHPVSLYVRARGQREARLLGFDLVQLGESSAITPETGLWWPEAGGTFETSGPGVGFSLEVQDGEAILMTNTYSDQGDARWLVSTGSLDGRIIRGDLTELGGGHTLFGEFREPGQAFRSGRALLEFHSSSAATLWLVSNLGGEDLLVQPLSLVRFSFGPRSMLNGTWLLLPETGGEALRLDLAEVESSGGTVTLLDGSGSTVTCERLLSKTLSPPDSCRLRGIQDIRFHDVGLDRWRGTDAAGVAYIAVRLDP